MGGTKRKCAASISSASPGARSSRGSCCHLLSLSQDLLLQYLQSLLNDQSSPFSVGLFSSAHKRDWLSFMLKVLLWFPHPAPVTAHFSASLHSLVSQNSQIMSLPLHHFTKTSCVKVTIISMLSSSMDNLFSHLTHSLSCIRSRWLLLHHWFSSYLWCLWQFLLSLCCRLSSNVYILVFCRAASFSLPKWSIFIAQDIIYMLIMTILVSPSHSLIWTPVLHIQLLDSATYLSFLLGYIISVLV